MFIPVALSISIVVAFLVVLAVKEVAVQVEICRCFPDIGVIHLKNLSTDFYQFLPKKPIIKINLIQLLIPKFWLTEMI